MKIRIKKDQIIEGLQQAGSIIPAKAGAAYLRSIWLNAKDGHISIMTTDANTEFTGTYEAEVEEEGLAGVLGRIFVDLIRQCPAGQLELMEDDQQHNLIVRKGRQGRYKLPVYSSEWFQAFAPFPAEDPVLWSGDFLLDLIEKILFCIDDDEARDAMSCLCFMPRENGKIQACGMNGHQFAMLSFINDELCAKLPEKGLLVQKKYLPDLKKWLPAEDIELNLSDKRLFFKGREGTETLSIVRASNYEYPDYNVFLSRLEGEAPASLEINRKEAIDVLKRLVVFAPESGQPCVLIRFSPKETTFTARGSDGSARESMEAMYRGELEEIAFPTRDLLEILNHFSSEKIRMDFTAAEGPCGISGEDDRDYLVVLMPMRVANELFYPEDNE